MLEEGEEAPQNDLDSCRGNFLIGANFFSLAELLTRDLVSLDMEKSKTYENVSIQI